MSSVKWRFERRAARAEQAGWVTERARLVAIPSVDEGACARAERQAHEMKVALRGVIATGIRETGATATCKPNNHGEDCRRWMLEADFNRTYEGSDAVVVRAAHGDDPRVLVHLCGKSGPKCRFAAAYNRVPDSYNMKSDLTSMVGKCAARRDHPKGTPKYGYMTQAMRDTGTPYILRERKTTTEAHTGMTEA